MFFAENPARSVTHRRSLPPTFTRPVATYRWEGITQTRLRCPIVLKKLLLFPDRPLRPPLWPEIAIPLRPPPARDLFPS
jgi:hypothetical protein